MSKLFYGNFDVRVSRRLVCKKMNRSGGLLMKVSDTLHLLAAPDLIDSCDSFGQEARAFGLKMILI